MKNWMQIKVAKMPIRSVKYDIQKGGTTSEIRRRLNSWTDSCPIFRFSLFLVGQRTRRYD